MSKKKKKQMTIILVMVLVLALVAIGYAVLLKYNAQKEAEDNETINLLTLDSSLATEIDITNSNGDIKFVKDSDTWKLDGDDSFYVDEDKISTLLDEFSSIDAVKMVADNKDNLSDYGLDDPQATATIVLSDGTQAVISLGSEVPVAGGYYGMLDDNDSIYTFASDVFADLFYAQSDFEGEAPSASPDATPSADPETSPEVTAES